MKTNFVLTATSLALIALISWSGALSNSGTDSISVSGYGENANTDIFREIYPQLANIKCSDLVNNGYLDEAGYELAISSVIQNTPADTVLDCKYTMNDLSEIRFELYPYLDRDKVASSPESMRTAAQADAAISTFIQSQEIGYFAYDFGLTEQNECVAVFTSVVNEFRYGKFTFELKDSDSCYAYSEFTETVIEGTTNLIGERLEQVYLSYYGLTTKEVISQYGI